MSGTDKEFDSEKSSTTATAATAAPTVVENTQHETSKEAKGSSDWQRNAIMSEKTTSQMLQRSDGIVR